MAPKRTKWSIGLLVALCGVFASVIGFGVGDSAQASANATSITSLSPKSTAVAPIPDYSGGRYLAADPNGGYWTVNWAGAVAAHGGAPSFGSPVLSGLHLNKPMAGMAATRDGLGYWLVASDGGIFSFGDATFYGSTGAIHLNQPIVGMAVTPDGGGYWLVASDGGIFSFGDATFYGSTGAIHLNQPIVGMAVTPDGGGYWLVASDGGIFSFGDATFYGSTGAIHLNQPIVGMAVTPDGGGYWLVASDGGIFSFGDATFYGTPDTDTGGVIGIIISPPTPGYTFVQADGSSVDPSLAAAPPVQTALPSSPTTTTTSPASPPTTTSPPSTTTTPTAGATGGADFGLSIPTLEGETSSEQAAALANMYSIGLRWVRIDANWSWIQYAGPSSFDWSVLDQAVSAITAAGMKVELIVDDAPSWASGSTQNWTQPLSASAFANFAGEVAAHYGPMGVSAYEIWNEPNLQGFWNPAPNPSFYTTMLQDSYVAIKAAEPNATVISGGLAPAEDDSAGDIAPIEFLSDMYADGARGSFDALGYHAYSNPALPNTYETWSGWSEMDQTSPSLRSVMTANGDAGKQIWITEIGAPSAGPNGVGTAAQAEEVTQAVQDAQSTSWIGPLFFYTYQDAATDPDYYGLLNADGSAKPAWAALAAALS